VANAYALADRRQARASGTQAPGLILAVAGSAAASWLSRASIWSFLDAPSYAVPGHAAGLAARLGLLVAAVLALRSYDAVVRAPDRAAVELHPLRAADWVDARIGTAARGALPWLLAVEVGLWPLWSLPPVAAAAATVVAGAWFAGLGAGLGVNLAATAAARSPAFHGLLDAVRGPNPRSQAALLWAPGVALALAGLATALAAWGAGRALEGELTGIVALLAPLAVGAAGVVLARRSAGEASRVGLLLAEVEVAWAGAEERGEGSAVYLEWVARRVPRAWRAELLRELRHGWRDRRAWLAGSWGLAALAGLAGWTDAGGGRAVPTVGALLAIFGVIGLRLRAVDPAWLEDAFPRPARTLALRLAVWAWMQPVVLAAAFTTLVRRGAHAWTSIVAIEACSLALAALAGSRRSVLYAPAALGVVAAAAAL
jgi:hypothetical protein